MTMREELVALVERWRKDYLEPGEEWLPDVNQRFADELEAILARYANSVSLRADVAEAVFSRLRLYEMAENSCPEVPISQVRACACTGPAGNCRCMKEQRLADEFHRAMIQAAAKAEDTTKEDRR